MAIQIIAKAVFSELPPICPNPIPTVNINITKKLVDSSIFLFAKAKRISYLNR